MAKTSSKILIIGAGPAGAAAARILADSECSVDIFDARPEVGGNCYDARDEHGVLVHPYGPHYFRSDSEELISWLSRFTEWIPGRYYVRARVGSKLIPLPVSLATMTELKGELFTREKFEAYLLRERVVCTEPRNAEEQCLMTVGRELYETIFQGYSRKQWGVHPRELGASVTARLPLRFNWDERYPAEQYQVTPRAGFTAMFRKMLDHPGIRVTLNSRLKGESIKSVRADYRAVIYSGAIDSFFDLRYGPLGYRSLRYRWEYSLASYMQPCVQINYPNEHEFTRSVEIKHVTGQDCEGTTVGYEYPESEGEPFYPLLTEENRARYQKYKALADQESREKTPVYFLGRLAQYQYLNMDHVFLRSIDLAKKIAENQ